MTLSDRIRQIEPSGTVHLTRLIQQLTNQGRDIIPLAVGEPPYDTPGMVIEATQQAARRPYKIQWGGGSAGIKIMPGTAYLFPNVRHHLKDGMTSAEFAGRLLENSGVAVVPGEVFGMAGHIRISYAVSQDRLVSGFEKIAEVL